MKIAADIKDSKTVQIWEKLFGKEKGTCFADTGLGKLLTSLSFPRTSLFLTFSAIILFWYETLFDKFLPFLGTDFLPVVLVAAAFLVAPKGQLRLRKFHFWYLGFLLILLVSGLAAFFAGRGSTVLVIGSVFYFLPLLNLLLGETLNQKTLLKGLLFISLPFTVYGFFDFFLNKDKISNLSSLETGFRTSSFFGGPNVLGMVLVLLFFAGLYLYLLEKKKWYLVYLLAALVLLGLTFSRTAWLALVVGLLVWTLLWAPKYLLYAPLAAVALLANQIRKRVFVLFSPEYFFDSAIDGRVWTLRNGLHIWERHFLLGTGPGNYGGRLALSYASPVYLESMQNGYTALYLSDNNYIQILVQAGLVGVFLFVGFLLSLVAGISSLPEKNKKSFGLSVLASFLVFCLFANALEFTAVSLPAMLLLGSVFFKKGEALQK